MHAVIASTFYLPGLSWEETCFESVNLVVEEVEKYLRL